MPEDREDLLQNYRSTRQALLTAIGGLTDELMVETSLDGWSVKDHLAHVASWDDIRAQEVERISAGHASTWRLSPEQDEAFNALSYRARADLSVAQVRWELARSRERLLHAITAASPRGLDAALYGEAGLHSGHEAQHAGWIQSWRTARGL